MRTAGRLLARRSHGRAELGARVARRHGTDVAAQVVERLDDLGLVDDEAFAAELVARRLAGGWGPARLLADLHAAGVGDDLARSVVAAVPPADVDAAARRALRGRTGPAGWRVLGARGFDEDVAERLVGVPDA